MNLKVEEIIYKQCGISLEVLRCHHNYSKFLEKIKANRVFNWHSLIPYRKYKLKHPRLSDVCMQKSQKRSYS